MNNKQLVNMYLKEKMKIDDKVLEIIEKSELQVTEQFNMLDDILFYNQIKVLNAFQKNRISDMHFSWTTGYGYNDPGREAIERVYSTIFGTEASLVRPIIVNGTHALALTLGGILRPDDELIYASGAPYDTLEEVIGIRGKGKGNGSLKDFGIKYFQVDLTKDNRIDFDKLKNTITKKTKVITVQRATGYGFRRAITIPEIKEWVYFVKSINNKSYAW